MLRIPNHIEPSTDPLRILPDGVRQAVREKGALREYSAGDLMMAPCDNGDLIRFLVSGEASVMLRDGDEQALTVESLQPGDIFGEISFLTGRPTPSNSELVADEPCSVLEVPAGEFQNILEQNPQFTISLVRNLARK
ncbi:MAG: cyclic nucleotide-binding domain-containing protein, partial [Desulfomonile tiedjei]|nr:cyclic nucleotide-binding domain-containing protein [Desulfomonile tiedjei]